jgi:tRNA 2-thiouridine synthesizing protein A
MTEMVDRFAPSTARQWDTGEAGCSQLIVGLKERITELKPGETIEVTSRNSGAYIDIFVWCRMTGHRLISEAHPVYVIQRNGNST